MDFGYPPEAEAYRAKVRAFLDANLPVDWKGVGALPDDELYPFLERWRTLLRDNGFIGITWPTQYGGQGLTALEQVVLHDEFGKRGVPDGSFHDNFGVKMVGNTVLQWGTEEQKRHYVPRIISGEDLWCQGYSEPDFGSDLAGLQTKAVLDGDQWVMNGQKIWTSQGYSGNWIFVLARTDTDAPKHKGISFLLVPMDQPGIEVRRIKQISGLSEFAEVFFTDARTPRENVIGPVNGGWAVANTLLGYERGASAATFPIMFREEFDRLLAMAKERGVTDHPVIRQRIADCYARVEVMRYLGYGTLTKFLAGQPPGRETGIVKLYWSEYHQKLTELAVDILGADALTPEGHLPRTPTRADFAGTPNTSLGWVGMFLGARAETIYAGTSQIQRNVAGETILGLPREPR
ncbi:MAG: acyl-CoA dehydrogenase family protein [Acidimicrobiia bacterium]